jgi:hypothetical protein
LVRLRRDYYVRVADNDYSVDPTAIGQLVEVSTHRVAVLALDDVIPLT